GVLPQGLWPVQTGTASISDSCGCTPPFPSSPSLLPMHEKRTSCHHPGVQTLCVATASANLHPPTTPACVSPPRPRLNWPPLWISLRFLLHWSPKGPAGHGALGGAPGEFQCFS